jgi:hypothetical protein
MGERQSAGSGDHGPGVHDRVLAFARERGATVRPVPTSSDMVTVEVPKGVLLVEVAFQNSTQPHPKAVSAEEWFITARDPHTSKELWNGRFSYWEWQDAFGDAAEVSDEEWFEGMGDQLIALLDALLTNEVRLAEVEKKPLFRLVGWGWPSGKSTELQLLIDGEWHAWDGCLDPVVRNEHPSGSPP